MVKAGCTRGHVGALEGWRACWRVGGHVGGLEGVFSEGWRACSRAGVAHSETCGVHWMVGRRISGLEGVLEGWRACSRRVGGRVRGLGWRVQRSAGCIGWLAGTLEKGKAGW
jgi:hypothetical protein